MDARDNFLWADTGHIAVLGVSDLVVVRTGDTVMVIPKDRAQDVKQLVDALTEAGRDELL